MATWNITVPAGSGVGGTGTGSAAITEPGDFDGATINSVTVSGTPSVSSDTATDDAIGIRWYIRSTTPTDIYGSTGSDAASLCAATLGSLVTSATITAGGASSPAPGTAVAADWDEIAYAANYSANMKDDGETVSWSSFTVVVDYTVAAGEDDLLADDVQSTSNVTSPVIEQEHALLAEDVSSNSEVTAPVVGQEHALTAVSVESTSEVSAPALADVPLPDDLLANDVESASGVDAPVIGQVHALLAEDVSSASGVSAPTVALPSTIEPGFRYLTGRPVFYSGRMDLTPPLAVSTTDALLANNTESAT